MKNTFKMLQNNNGRMAYPSERRNRNISNGSDINNKLDKCFKYILVIVIGIFIGFLTGC